MLQRLDFSARDAHVAGAACIASRSAAHLLADQHAPVLGPPPRRVLICQVRRGPRGDAGCVGHVCIACAEVEPGPGQRGRPTEAARPAGGFSPPSNIHTVLCHSSPGLGSTSLLLQGGRPPWLSTLSSFEVVY